MNHKVKHPDDTPEQIQMCLSCKRTRCVDCIGRNIPCDQEGYVGKAKIVNGIRLNKTAVEVLRLYRTAKSDQEIAEKLGKSYAGIARIRYKLKLPAFRFSTEEERNRIVDKWIEKGA